MKKRLSVLLLAAIMMIVTVIPVMAATGTGTENWIDAIGMTAEPQNSRDVRNNTNGFGTKSYTPISFNGKVTLYAQNYGYKSGDNYDIKLYVADGSGYTQVGKLYGEGDKLQVEVFKGHSIKLVWQRHQMDNRYYVVELSGPIARTYTKDFKGKDTGYTSGNIYVEYKGPGSVTTPPENDPSDPTGDVNNNPSEKWINSSGTMAKPKKSRDVRNNTNGFDTNTYTPISFNGKVTLYAQNYAFNSGDNYDIKLYIANGNGYTQVGKLYGEGDKLQVEVFKGHSITLVWQRHQMDNQYYKVELSGPITRIYEKDFQGKDTGYTSGNIYVKYGT